MADRRLVGIDLGITSGHTVRVLAGDGTTVCRRKAVPTVASLAEVEQAALAGTAPATPKGTQTHLCSSPVLVEQATE